MADEMVGAAETMDEMRRRRMMQKMLESQAAAPLQSSDAAPMSPLQPLGQIANAAAAQYGANKAAPALAPVPGDGVGPPALAAGAGGGISDILKKLMSGMGG
jgi:hypothetical protein